MAEYIVNTGGGSIASVEYNIGIEPYMRINLITATFDVNNVERVIRCRDCKFFEHCKLQMISNNPDGFCAWGEPKD